MGVKVRQVHVSGMLNFAENAARAGVSGVCSRLAARTVTASIARTMRGSMVSTMMPATLSVMTGSMRLMPVCD